MIRSGCVSALAWAIAVTVAQPAGAAEAEDVFQSLYGDDCKKVAATRDPADDVALAARLLAVAQSRETQPALAAILCRHAYDLAVTSPSGYETAIEAMELLGESEQPVDALDRIVAIRTKQHAAARGLERATTGEFLVEALLVSADAHAAAADTAGSLALYRQALTAAGAVKSDRRAEVQFRMNRLQARIRAEKGAGDLKTRLDADPQDLKTREELLRLYLVEMDDPARAATVLSDACDAALCKCIPAAAKGPDAAPELACMELAEWYRGLSDDPGLNTGAKGAMLYRAYAYYQRFLMLHKAQDLPRNAATLAVKKVQDALARLGAPPPTDTVGPGRWVDLLKLVDIEKDVPGSDKTAYAMQGDGLRMPKGAWTRIDLPCLPEGSYELRAVVVRLDGMGPLTIVLPVGGHQTALVFAQAENAPWLARSIEKPATARPTPLDNGRAYKVSVKVSVLESRATVDAAIDGQQFFSWQGLCSSLALAVYVPTGHPRALGLCAAGAEVLVKDLRLRMVSGTAKSLR